MSEIHITYLPISASKPAKYTYNPGDICVIFSHEKGYIMPMRGREMPFPAFSNYLFFEMKEAHTFHFKSEEDSFAIVLHTPLEKLHALLADGESEISLPVDAMREHQSYHKFGANTPQVSESLKAVSQNQGNRLLLEAKKLELINYYFIQKEDKVYNCPFLNQQENVDKVRLAKKELIQNLQESPTIKDLAKSVGMNEHNLKSGFKEIYGKPIHAFLKNHKMTVAKELILSKQLSINDIAHEVGYSNVSHFIEAFRKKYGQTPKQFELHLN